MMLARYVRRAAEQHQDPAWPFRGIAEHFASADIAFANLESPFALTGPYFEKRMVFRTHPSMVEGLKLAGLDVISTANNHSRDAGPTGIDHTLRILRESGITPVGTTTEPAILAKHGVRFGFLAYTFDQRNGNTLTDDPRVAMLDPATIGGDIAKLKQGCDIVIVSMHAGWEYQKRPNRLQIRFARAAIDGGAAIVVGHHPHIYQPVERYKNGLIFYSLGNLVFDQAQRPGVRQGVVADVFFTGPQIQRYELREVIMRGSAPTLGPLLQ
jgi:poly-gamma-glutamate synthesis protein (capsule biosynthesis protein)